ncbi:hypothetical protein RYX36_005584, partial [Vicia faba]
GDSDSFMIIYQKNHNQKKSFNKINLTRKIVKISLQYSPCFIIDSSQSGGELQNHRITLSARSHYFSAFVERPLQGISILSSLQQICILNIASSYSTFASSYSKAFQFFHLCNKSAFST